MKVTWYETSSAYYVVAEDGREACCGDGVDMFSVETEEGEKTLSPGTTEFDAAMDEFCEDPETFEAYFG